MCWWNLEELIEFAGKMYYDVSKETYRRCKNEIDERVGEEVIKEKLEKLNPINHIHITYDEAVAILKEAGIDATVELASQTVTVNGCAHCLEKAKNEIYDLGFTPEIK